MKYPKKYFDSAVSMTKPIVDGLGKGIDAVTGKAVIEEVTKFALETDAINTAIVTRIYQILNRQTKVEEEIKQTQSEHRRTRTLLIASLVLNAFCLLTVVFILVRGR